MGADGVHIIVYKPYKTGLCFLKIKKLLTKLLTFENVPPYFALLLA